MLRGGVGVITSGREGQRRTRERETVALFGRDLVSGAREDDRLSFAGGRKDRQGSLRAKTLFLDPAGKLFL